MQESIQKLSSKFNKIKAQGFIKGLSNGSGNAGRTLEYLLGKRTIGGSDVFPTPDYYGIEIKTRFYNSQYKISLFSVVPDGPEPFEIKRIAAMYGYPAKELKTANVLFGEIGAKSQRSIGRHFNFKLEVNRDDQKIYLVVYNKYGSLIEKKSYWSFDSLEERLNLKLSYLALIKVRGRIIEGEDYFSYQDIKFFKLKSFDKFLDLIEDEVLTLVTKIDIHKDAARLGQTYDHGTSFQIAEENLPLLFDEITI